MSQDCDLDWDFRGRQEGGSPTKQMPNILFCEMIEADILRQASGMNSRIWERIKINKDERYQFFQRVLPAEDAVGVGLPELGTDFKRYFTLPTDEVYQQLRSEGQRRCQLVSPYREHLSNRFYSFQARIALPTEHLSE